MRSRSLEVPRPESRSEINFVVLDFVSGGFLGMQTLEYGSWTPVFVSGKGLVEFSWVWLTSSCFFGDMGDVSLDFHGSG